MTVRVGVDAWGLTGPTRYTGMGQYAEQLLRLLPLFDASVVAYGAPGERAPRWLPAAAEWRAPAATGPRRTAALETRLRALPAAAAADGLEVFHVPGLHVRPSFPPVPRMPCPVVVTVHDAIPATFYGRTLPLRNRLYWRWNLRRAAHAAMVLTVSEHARREVCATARLRPERVHVVSNPVAFRPNNDVAVLDRLGVRPPFLLFAGSFEPRKNLATTLAAFDIVADELEGTTLVAVVEAASGHAADGRRRVEALRHGNRVCLLSALDQPELEALYTAAACVVFSSLAEGFGLPALQAAACGTPLVASDLPVLREVAADLPVYVDPVSPESVAQGIRRCLSDRRVQERMLAEGPPLANRHEPRAWAEGHLRLYRTMREEHADARV